MPYDPFDFDDADGYHLVPVDQAWPQVDLMADPNMRRHQELHPDVPLAHPTARSRRRVPAAIVPGRHGGWRPGAGAPAGNTNAFKTGAHSRRMADAARLIVQSPELTRLIAGIVAAKQRNNRRRTLTALEVAYEATLTDPASRNSINQILQNGVLRRLAQVQPADPRPKSAKNNQTIKPATQAKCKDAASAPSAHAPGRPRDARPYSVNRRYSVGRRDGSSSMSPRTS